MLQEGNGRVNSVECCHSAKQTIAETYSFKFETEIFDGRGKSGLIRVVILEARLCGLRSKCKVSKWDGVGGRGMRRQHLQGVLTLKGKRGQGSRDV